MVQKIVKLDSKAPPRYVTVTHGMSGFFAVLVWWNAELGDGPDDGFWEPWNTGIGRYKTSHEAAVEAEQWAEAEELPFYDPYNRADKPVEAQVSEETQLKPGGTQKYIDHILDKAAREKDERAVTFPTIEDALKMMAECKNRLRDDGWRDIHDRHWPKDQNILTICVGCLTPMETMVSGTHPNYTFMVADHNDWWPANPILWKPFIKESQPSKKPL